MFGAFRASAPRSGGLLWKIPWKLSQPQKARHRRRMQHVDRVGNVLDTALKAQHRANIPVATSTPSTTSATSTTSTTASTQSSDPTPLPPGYQDLTPADLASTAEGARLLAQQANKAILARRSGRGPKQGEILPDVAALDPEAAGLATTTPSTGTNSSLGTNTGTIKPLRLVADQVRDLGTFALLERWKADMPTEAEMLPRDKYTIFDRKARGYRKGIHKLPKWTRVSQRLNPPGF